MLSTTTGLNTHGSVRRVAHTSSSRRGCQARAQQQDEQKREMPKGIDFEYEATNEVPEPDFWGGEQWEV